MIRTSLRYLRTEPTSISQLLSRTPIKIVYFQDLNEAMVTRDIQRWRYDSNSDCMLGLIDFEDFSQAMCFLNNAAPLIQELQHFPKWFNVYNQFEIYLNTTECSGVSERDVYLAIALDRIADSVLSAGDVSPDQILVSNLDDLFQ